MIKLGSKVKDSISGYEGIATSRTVYLNGCVGICIEGPLAKDEKGVFRSDDLWVDEQRVEVLDSNAWTPKGAYATDREQPDENPPTDVTAVDERGGVRGPLALERNRAVLPGLARAGGPLGSSTPPRDGAR